MSPASALPELPGSLSRSFVADPNAPPAARRALQGLDGHVGERLLERAGIVVTELVTNSVRHARLAPAQQIELRVSARRRLLRIEVIDDGDGFDPTAIRPDTEQRVGGWGLRLVADLTDRWGVEVSHSTRVWRVRHSPRTRTRGELTKEKGGTNRAVRLAGTPRHRGFGASGWGRRPAYAHGPLAVGLQSRVHRFDSGRRLWSTGKAQRRGVLLLAYRAQGLGKATALQGSERL